MIANERQYKIARQQLVQLRDSLERAEVDSTRSRVGSRGLAEAEIAALKSQVESIAAEIHDYEALQSGAVSIPADVGLAELPHLLIRARIARGLSQRDLAERVGLKEQQIQRYESQEYASASLRRLRQVAGALGLRVVGAPGGTLVAAEREDQKEVVVWRHFPVKEMYRRGWFEGFSGSLSEAVSGAEDLVRDFVERTLSAPLVALHHRKVRAGGEYDRYALLAWQCRILSLAEKRDSARYRASNLDGKWFKALIRTSRENDGPIRARNHLAEAGIVLVVEPHLTGTFLDGAALLQRSRPVIGLTLRYDRLDHFWFVLIHELVHAKRHLRNGIVEGVFDDLEADVADEVEREADTQAAELIIPEKVWKKAIARFTRSQTAVVTLASELGINPAIVAGRIRYEARNYVILNELVGQGEARKHFPEASFGA